MTHDTDLDYLWEKRHKLVYKAELSALYHQKRERFFELLDKLTKAATVFFGSAALARITDAETVKALMVVITAGSALSLVFSFSERARRHAELSTKFKRLLTAIHEQGERDFDEAHLNKWHGEYCSIETGEPPSLTALTAICQNELAIAQGREDHVRPIGFIKRQLAHVIDFQLTSAPQAQ